MPAFDPGAGNFADFKGSFTPPTGLTELDFDDEYRPDGASTARRMGPDPVDPDYAPRGAYGLSPAATAARAPSSTTAAADGGDEDDDGFVEYDEELFEAESRAGPQSGETTSRHGVHQHAHHASLRPLPPQQERGDSARAPRRAAHGAHGLLTLPSADATQPPGSAGAAGDHFDDYDGDEGEFDADAPVSPPLAADADEAELATSDYYFDYGHHETNPFEDTADANEDDYDDGGDEGADDHGHGDEDYEYADPAEDDSAVNAGQDESYFGTLEAKDEVEYDVEDEIDIGTDDSPSHKYEHPSVAGHDDDDEALSFPPLTVASANAAAAAATAKAVPRADSRHKSHQKAATSASASAAESAPSTDAPAAAEEQLTELSPFVCKGVCSGCQERDSVISRLVLSLGDPSPLLTNASAPGARLSARVSTSAAVSEPVRALLRMLMPLYSRTRDHSLERANTSIQQQQQQFQGVDLATREAAAAAALAEASDLRAAASTASAAAAAAESRAQEALARCRSEAAAVAEESARVRAAATAAAHTHAAAAEALLGERMSWEQERAAEAAALAAAATAVAEGRRKLAQEQAELVAAREAAAAAAAADHETLALAFRSVVAEAEQIRAAAAAATTAAAAETAAAARARAAAEEEASKGQALLARARQDSEQLAALAAAVCAREQAVSAAGDAVTVRAGELERATEAASRDMEKREGAVAGARGMLLGAIADQAQGRTAAAVAAVSTPADGLGDGEHDDEEEGLGEIERMLAEMQQTHALAADVLKLSSKPMPMPSISRVSDDSSSFIHGPSRGITSIDNFDGFLSGASPSAAGAADGAVGPGAFLTCLPRLGRRRSSSSSCSSRSRSGSRCGSRRESVAAGGSDRAAACLRTYHSLRSPDRLPASELPAARTSHAHLSDEGGARVGEYDEDDPEVTRALDLLASMDSTAATFI